MTSINRRERIYLAAPLFSVAEREYNVKLKRQLSLDFDVYLPQEDGGLIVNMVNMGLPIEKAYRRVFQGDIQAIDRSDILVMIMDGRVIDEGAAVELGYAYAKGKACYGIKTDPRQLLSIGDNPMISGPLIRVFDDVKDFLSFVSSNSAKAIASLSEA